MKKVGRREFRNRQGYYLRRVCRGETLLITDRGKVIARIEPIASLGIPADPLEERLHELAAQGHLRLGTRRFTTFEPVATRGKPASRMIIEDRE